MIDSRTIEGQLQDRGCALRVFNMGFANLTLEESDYLLSEILNIPNNNFQMIILDEPLTGLQHLDQARSRRTQMLSGTDITTRRFENIWSYQESWQKKLYRSAINVYSTAYGALNIGLLSRKIFSNSYDATLTEQNIAISEEVQTFEKRGGFKVLEDNLGTNKRASIVHKNFLAQVAQFDKKLRNILKQKIKPSPFSAKPRATIIKQQLNKITQYNIQAGFYVAPLPNRISENNSLVKTLGKATYTLNYNDPRQMPMLWNSKYWFDPYHLNQEGARIMSQDIGRRLYESTCPKFAHTTETGGV
ncbi:MAG: SGNH/GDSL hydrolase family protein [Alphaproteobacteria bacterium]|nr:SGNH/GDSL hydrolase family protein [Alphaproteobacteria bacterium]